MWQDMSSWNIIMCHVEVKELIVHTSHSQASTPSFCRLYTCSTKSWRKAWKICVCCYLYQLVILQLESPYPYGLLCIRSGIEHLSGLPGLQCRSLHRSLAHVVQQLETLVGQPAAARWISYRRSLYDKDRAKTVQYSLVPRPVPFSGARRTTKGLVCFVTCASRKEPWKNMTVNSPRCLPFQVYHREDVANAARDIL